MNVLILHGPNLNLLGEREPEIYGRLTLAALNARLRAQARALRLKVRIAQRNGEGELLDLLHRNRRWADGVLINPAAYTHTSVALLDGLKGVNLPVVEVHLSNTARREAFRRRSFTAKAARAVFQGEGVKSYLKGLRKLAALIREGK